VGLSKTGEKSVQDAFGRENTIFPGAEWTRGVLGTILEGKYAEKEWEKLAELDILGMAKTCEFSGKIILHAGLPPGVPEINEALDISRKIFWKLDGGIEGVTENAEIPGAETAIILPNCRTLGLHASKSDMEMDENCAGMASEKDTMS
jgi:hypothetical protein